MGSMRFRRKNKNWVPPGVTIQVKPSAENPLATQVRVYLSPEAAEVFDILPGRVKKQHNGEYRLNFTTFPDTGASWSRYIAEYTDLTEDKAIADAALRIRTLWDAATDRKRAIEAREQEWRTVAVGPSAGPKWEE